jgi:ABC-type nitrate/sulfonate/bicarbonate transport system permease component
MNPSPAISPTPAPAPTAASASGWRRGAARLTAPLIGLTESAYPLALLVIIWESVARMGWVDHLFLPRFSDVAVALWSGLFQTGFLMSDAAISLGRAFTGLVIGGTTGVVLGTLMGQFRPVRQFLDPLVSFLFPMPKMALFPIVMVLFGLGETSKIAMVAISTFFPVAINTYMGIRNVDKFLIWNALSKGANQAQLLGRVLIPAATPYIFAGFRVAVSLSFLITVTVEMLQSNNGLGFRILFARSMYEPETMYAALLLVAVLGFSVDRLVRVVGGRLLVWQETIEP